LDNKTCGAAAPRPELLANSNITVYLCNNDIRFMKQFYPSVLYFFAFVAILKKIRCILAVSAMVLSFTPS
jgi:hypothetical protein